MTERDEVPTTAEVRERFIDGFPIDTWVVARATLGDEFDRWLSDHDEAVRQEERKKAARWKAAADSADALLRAVMVELDIRPDEDPVLAVRGIVAGIRNDEREKAAQIADRLHGVGNDIIAARIRRQGKEQGA